MVVLQGRGFHLVSWASFKLTKKVLLLGVTAAALLVESIVSPLARNRVDVARSERSSGLTNAIGLVCRRCSLSNFPPAPPSFAVHGDANDGPANAIFLAGLLVVYCFVGRTKPSRSHHDDDDPLLQMGVDTHVPQCMK
jgi:hypothetical protein